MSTKGKRTTRTKKTTARPKKQAPAKRAAALRATLKKILTSLKTRHAAFMKRRPHRSLRRTRRRDYARSLRLPGYHAFTLQVWRMLISHKKTFIFLTLTYALIMIIVGGVTSQETYTKINDLLKQSSKDIFGDGMGKVGQASLLAVSAFLTGPGNLTSDQQIYLGLTLLFVWLASVWLLREYLLNRKPKLRDALYTSGAPVLSTMVVLFVMIVQLLPIGLVALAYAGLVSVGILDGGFASMLFWIFAGVVSLMVLYWITSTFIALVIVTLPGMYPLHALKLSSDIVIGRRLRILYRLLWGLMTMLLAWLCVMVPVILLDTLVKSAWTAVADAPFVPLVAAVMSAFTVVWFSAYVYLLYRRIVDDDAKPA